MLGEPGASVVAAPCAHGEHLLGTSPAEAAKARDGRLWRTPGQRGVGGLECRSYHSGLLKDAAEGHPRNE